MISLARRTMTLEDLTLCGMQAVGASVDMPGALLGQCGRLCGGKGAHREACGVVGAAGYAAGTPKHDRPSRPGLTPISVFMFITEDRLCSLSTADMFRVATVFLQAAAKELKARTKAVSDCRRPLGRNAPETAEAAEAALSRLQNGAQEAEQPQVSLNTYPNQRPPRVWYQISTFASVESSSTPPWYSLKNP